MKNKILGILLVVGVVISMPALAGSFFSSCKDGSDTPRPEWLKDGYSELGFYVGVGQSDNKDRAKRQAESEARAAQHLAEHIEVKLESVNEQRTTVSGQQVTKEDLSKLKASTAEVLRGLVTKDRWIDDETCTLYTLKVIKKTAVAKAKREKMMRAHLARFKVLLAEGGDRDKHRDVNERHTLFKDAKEQLAETDFKYIPEENNRQYYETQLNNAIAAIGKERMQAKDRMALFVLNSDHTLNDGVIGKMVDQMIALEPSIVRLMSQCDQEQDCIQLAHDRAFTKLTILEADCKVSISQMGSMKGKLTLVKKIYDLESRKEIAAPRTMWAEIIGWSRDGLDWNAAADKVMQGMK